MQHGTEHVRRPNLNTTARTTTVDNHLHRWPYDIIVHPCRTRPRLAIPCTTHCQHHQQESIAPTVSCLGQLNQFLLWTDTWWSGSTATTREPPLTSCLGCCRIRRLRSRYRSGRLPFATTNSLHLPLESGLTVARSRYCGILQLLSQGIPTAVPFIRSRFRNLRIIIQSSRRAGCCAAIYFAPHDITGPSHLAQLQLLWQANSAQSGTNMSGFLSYSVCLSFPRSA
jgi:hypothetical protein